MNENYMWPINTNICTPGIYMEWANTYQDPLNEHVVVLLSELRSA